MNWVSFSHLPRPHVDYMCSINANWKAQITNQYIFQDSVCIYFFRWQHQRSCTRHMFSFRHYLQGPREVCFVLLPVDVSCRIRPGQNFHSLFCSRPIRGRNRQSRSVSFETLSTLYCLFFGSKIHRMHRHCQDRLYKHCWLTFQLCRVQYSSVL